MQLIPVPSSAPPVQAISVTLAILILLAIALLIAWVRDKPAVVLLDSTSIPIQICAISVLPDARHAMMKAPAQDVFQDMSSKMVYARFRI